MNDVLFWSTVNLEYWKNKRIGHSGKADESLSP